MQNEDDLILAEKAKYESVWQHDDYRTFSPGLHALEHLNLIGCFRKLGVRSILDAGCGSGKFMRRILEQYSAEFTIRGFDIATNCLDPWFAGREAELLTTGCLWDPAALPRPNDAVVCTDVMEHIPTDKVPAVLTNLRAAATHAVFLGIALFPDYFGPKFLGKPLHLSIKPPEWWREQAEKAGMTPVSLVVQKDSKGAPAWLYLLARPAASSAAPAS